MSDLGGGWALEHRAASAAALHEPWPPPARMGRRTLAACHVTDGPALVLGSSQHVEEADAAACTAAGVAVVRRQSGGGAVVVAPRAQVWIDAWVPAGDPLFDEDVVRAARWFGEVWAAALESLGVKTPAVHAGRLEAGEWGRMLCFAGMGPGEVSAGGRKVMGLSQRRSRHGARFHSLAVAHWDAGAVAGLLAVDEAVRAQMASATATTAAGLGELLPELPAEGIVDIVERVVLQSAMAM